IGGQMLLLAPSATLNDETGVLQSWFDTDHTRWAILRPDRYVFAKGTRPAEAADALDLLFHQLRPERPQAHGRRHAQETAR
ncbi:MAG: 3-(3-hydroxy-phenyl)propionate hydroxylase, partial [Rhodospirillales bacterium]|nr:3-(3-hydroxy-phenyl)propionate hydroxylase [Rhodospirillales bacterium]